MLREQLVSRKQRGPSHQRIKLDSLMLNIITLNKVAFLIFVSFLSRDLQKEKEAIC